MSQLGSFPVRTWIIAMWYCVSFFQVPVASSRSFGDFSVWHSFVTTVKPHGTSFSTHAESSTDASQTSQWIPPFSVQRRLHSPLRSETGVTIRGRKMLFGTRDACSTQDLTLIQGEMGTTGGIPTFSVQILNLCEECALGDIHVACGDWASATPVDPYIFQRLSENDCLVNDGQPISSEGTVTFQYANSYMYPMRISSARSVCNNP